MKIYVLTRQYVNAPAPTVSVYLDVLKEQMKQEYDNKLSSQPTSYKKHGIKITHRIGKMSAFIGVEMQPPEHYKWEIEKAELSRNEMSAISSVYDDILLEERVVSKLKLDYDIENASERGALVEKIISAYRHNMQYGSDDVSAMDDAFEDMRDTIENSGGEL